MSQTVRISKADLPSQIAISNAEVIDASLPQSIVKYENGGTSDEFLATTQNSHNLPLTTFTNNVQGNTKIVIEKVPVYEKPNTKINCYVNSSGYIIVPDTYSLNVGDTIQFTTPPENAKKNTTYYVRSFTTTQTVNQIVYKRFLIQDAEDSTQTFQVKASVPFYQTRQSVYTMSIVVDPNSPKTQVLTQAIRAFSGKFKVGAILSQTYYEKKSKYVTYELSAANSNIKIFDRITVSNMINDVTFGASTLFNFTDVEVAEITDKFITVKVSSDISGYATSSTTNNVRMLKPRPLSIINIPTSNTVLYTKLKDGDVSLQVLPTVFTKTSINSGSLYLSYLNPEDRYYVKYTTKSPHHLVSDDIVNIYGINPRSLNISSKTVNNIKTQVTSNSFSFPVVFSQPEIGGNIENSIYFSTKPVNSSSDRTIEDPTKYLSGGFLDAVRYFIRYRMVSSDSNQTSKWTGVYMIENQHPETVDPISYDGGSNG